MCPIIIASNYVCVCHRLTGMFFFLFFSQEEEEQQFKQGNPNGEKGNGWWPGNLLAMASSDSE